MGRTGARGFELEKTGLLTPALLLLL